jgi:hypothetical protein
MGWWIDTLGKDRHEKTECARTLTGAKDTSGTAGKIKPQVKAGSGVAG